MEHKNKSGSSLGTRESIIIIELQKQVKEKTLNYCPD